MNARNLFTALLLAAHMPLALACGLLISWLNNQPNPARAVLPVATMEAPDRTPNAVFTSKEREKALLAFIEDLNAKPQDGLKFVAGLNFYVELGLLYLKDPARLDDAAKLFNDLKAKQNFAFRTLGRLGSAMVFAFKDQPAQSNKLFLFVVEKDKSEKEALRNTFWKNNPQLREMMAKALNYNLQNNPAIFPDTLKAYLHPPAATLKTAVP